MLRVSRIENGASTTLKLEGKLVGPWVAELTRLLLDSPSPSPLRMDLAGVTFVDADGADLLRHLINRGATIDACSSFVAELLTTEAR